MPEFIEVREQKVLDFHYVVVKLNGYVFSSKYSHMQRSPGQLINQLVNGAMGGVERNVWLRTQLTETAGHVAIEPTSLEINIYYADDSRPSLAEQYQARLQE